MIKDALSQMSMTFKGVRFCLKKYFRLLLSFGLLLSLILSLSITSFAGLKDLMIGSGSNALMTMELDDSDYAVMPMSSIGTVTNTIIADSLPISLKFRDGSGNAHFKSVVAYKNNGRYSFSTSAPDGAYLDYVQIELYSKDLPSSGSYALSFDYASHFSYDYMRFQFYSEKKYDNASTVTGWLNIPYNSSSGDLYVAPYNINLSNISFGSLFMVVPQSEYISNVGGSFSINFTPVSSGDYPSVGGSDTSTQDYQSDVSSSLSDLSSSVDTMTDEISGVTEAIQNLQGAMEPHYSNVLTQLHHITEQLHAFWDQQFNLHHVPLMAKLDEIKSAIANMDLEVVVELDELKQTVNNMSQAIQNKLQSVQDGINNKLQSVQDTLTGGYNTGGIDSDQGKLEDSLAEYEEAEKNVIDKVNDSLNDFEFDSGFEEYSNTISTISDFLQALYDSSGGFKVVINLSLMLSLASLVIGFYRFKG